MDISVNVDFSDNPGIMGFFRKCEEAMLSYVEGLFYGWKALEVHCRKGAASSPCPGLGLVE
jgi:hypothetical protein